MCLFIVAVAIIIFGGLVLDPCFVLQYFISFLVLQNSRWTRERELVVLFLLGSECHVAGIVV